jgi:hypothetical protein
MNTQRLTWTATVAATLWAGIFGRADAQYNRYGVHEVAAPVPFPDCRSGPGVVCFIDSTRHYSNECCASSSTAQWLILPAAGDSLEFYAESPSLHAFLTLDQPRHRSWQEHLPGLTAPFLRLRIPASGAYTLTVDLDPLDSAIGLPYELRVRMVAGKGLARGAPLLNIVGSPKTRLEVWPHGLNRAASAASAFDIRPGPYRVYAPGIDSLDICRVPCRTPQVIGLSGSRARTVRP